MFTTPKNFKSDFFSLHSKFMSRENFTFSKYADGEWSVIKNRSINNGEFEYDNYRDAVYRDELLTSFQFQHPKYYIGVSCPCCQGMDTHTEMIRTSGQNEEKITWANVWVNSNYRLFLENMVPEFSIRNVTLVCNEDSTIKKLPFIPEEIVLVKNNAWHHNYDVINYLKTNDVNRTFLFCCGPFGNILAHKLCEYNPDNTYLDIGSTLNPFLSTGFYRPYQNLSAPQMTCVWHD